MPSVAITMIFDRGNRILLLKLSEYIQDLSLMIEVSYN